MGRRKRRRSVKDNHTPHKRRRTIRQSSGIPFNDSKTTKNGQHPPEHFHRTSANKTTSSTNRVRKPNPGYINTINNNSKTHTTNTPSPSTSHKSSHSRYHQLTLSDSLGRSARLGNGGSGDDGGSSDDGDGDGKDNPISSLTSTTANNAHRQHPSSTDPFHDLDDAAFEEPSIEAMIQKIESGEGGNIPKGDTRRDNVTKKDGDTALPPPSEDVTSNADPWMHHNHDHQHQYQNEHQYQHDYDEDAIKTWIYPDNMEVRLYQQNIAQASLLRNTLVCLPTGLGKTFIAAVVMYNYYRWFPHGKVIFTAPTRPLVRQQIDACYHAMGISSHHLCQMTGKQSPASRRSLWQDHRIFFATPSVVANDLASATCPAADVVLVVVDEAHQASGNHAVCQMVRNLLQVQSAFRVLGLTATPGSRLPAVQEVLSNLRMGHVEVREEQDLDVRDYTHTKSIHLDVLPLSPNMQRIHNTFLPVVQPILSRLCQAKVYFESNPSLITQGRLVSALQRFRIAPPRNIPTWQSARIAGDFGAIISLAHAWELLNMYGYRPFLQRLLQLQEEEGDRPLEKNGRGRGRGKGKNTTRAKKEVLKHPGFKATIDMVQQYISDAECYHPKIKRLMEIVRCHFTSDRDGNGNKDDPPSHAKPTVRTGTRIIIFTEYRDSVEDILRSVASLPGVRAAAFVGQGSGSSGRHRGLRQTEQGEVLRRFRGGMVNTLVSTSIGEEGLDIGEVDLVVCYDARASPTRMVQRMGRTGRRRRGQVMVLVTEGAEERVYRSRKEHKSNIYSVLRSASYRLSSSSSSSLPSHCQSRGNGLHLIPDTPRMVPHHVHPTMERRTLSRPASPPPSRVGPGRRPRRQRRDMDGERRYVHAMLGDGHHPGGNGDGLSCRLGRRWREIGGSGLGVLDMVHRIQHSTRTQLLVRWVQHVQCGTETMMGYRWEEGEVKEKDPANVDTLPSNDEDNGDNGYDYDDDIDNEDKDEGNEYKNTVYGEWEGMSNSDNELSSSDVTGRGSVSDPAPAGTTGTDNAEDGGYGRETDPLPPAPSFRNEIDDDGEKRNNYGCLSPLSSASSCSSCSIPPPPSVVLDTEEDNEKKTPTTERGPGRQTYLYLEESVEESNDEEEDDDDSNHNHDNNKDENNDNNNEENVNPHLMDKMDGLSASEDRSIDGTTRSPSPSLTQQLCFFCSAQYNTADDLDRHLREYHHFGFDMSDDDNGNEENNTDNNHNNNHNNNNNHNHNNNNNSCNDNIEPEKSECHTNESYQNQNDSQMNNNDYDSSACNIDNNNTYNNNNNNNNEIKLNSLTTDSISNSNITLTGSFSDDSISSPSSSSSESDRDNVLYLWSKSNQKRNSFSPHIARRIREQRQQRANRRQRSRRPYHVLPMVPSVVEDSEAEKDIQDSDDPFDRHQVQPPIQPCFPNNHTPSPHPLNPTAPPNDEREDRRQHQRHAQESVYSDHTQNNGEREIAYRMEGNTSFDIGFLY